MAENAPIPCPKCSSTETEVVHLRVEYKRGDGGLDYAGGIQDMRCKGCGAEFLSQFTAGDDPPKNGRP